ncbi:MAG TPA: hypothetical protein PKE27_00810 [Povalibacter sp.]|uniref:hypothetical protein n=1 Tax=Povalibacter sp. TaxID=1962978 RepID=UPI002BE70642|nr:hypothetical protein [Povalibacter sp.]HMN43089.1 hypothetical protein [Povalibacter sp.]
MWFARLFGGRDDGSDDELPTATAPQRPVGNPSATVSKQPVPVQNGAKAAPKKPTSFDPYNSGSFERHKAWERIGRR